MDLVPSLNEEDSDSLQGHNSALQQLEQPQNPALEPATENSTIKFYNYHEYFLQPDQYVDQLGYLENPNLNTTNDTGAETAIGHSYPSLTVNESVATGLDSNIIRNNTNYPPAAITDQKNAFNSEKKTLQVPPKVVLMAHFPNSYYPLAHPMYRRTRIVRIPREFQAYGDIVPQFSTSFPGFEPGAVHSRASKQRRKQEQQQGGDQTDLYDSDSDDLEAEAAYMLAVPDALSRYISHERLREVVTTVNALLKSALWPYSAINIFEQLMGYATCWMHLYVLHFWLTLVVLLVPRSVAGFLPATKDGSLSYLATHTGRTIHRLEQYIAKINNELAPQNVRIVSPLRSAYLSLDIEIPSPIPGEEYEE